MKARMKQASFERKTGDSIWVEARRGETLGLGEGCPRPYVTEETSASALEWLSAKQPELERELTSFDALRTWVDVHAAELDLHNGAWCAVELALLDLFAREKGCTVEALLGVPETRDVLQYTAVVSDESGEALDKLLGRYLGVGFTDFKFKLSGEHAPDEAKLARFTQLKADAPGPFRVRLDCNNAWGTEPERALAELKRLASHDFFAVEEPLTARRAKDLSRLSTELGAAIVLDESLCRVSDVALYRGLPGEWIANVKVSKAGGLLRALQLISAARSAGWKVIIGAQVAETSVLTRAGIIAARAAGDSLLAVEGGFGTLLLEEDLTEPVLMFGFGGTLTVSEAMPAGAHGFGLTRNSNTGGMAP
jgi:L-alanine-DL-glutamate epimerase-like enolase superfamily enzyme